MNDSRLIKLLRTFTEEELNSLVKFIESPFLKPARDISGFFKYIKENLSGDKSLNLEKRLVFKNVFHGEKYNERKLINHMFDLTKTAEDFLSYSTLKENETEFQINLSKSYLNRHLPKDSMRVIKALEKNLVPGFSVKKDYISKFRRMTQLKNAYYTEVNDYDSMIEIKSDYFSASVIQFVVDYLEILSNKEPVKSTGRDINNQFIKAVNECFDVDKFLETVKNENSQKPYISIFYYLLKLLNEPEDTHYYKLRDLFYNNLSKKKSPFDREEKYTIFNYLINYCTQQHTMPFMKEAFNVYKTMLEHNAYSESESDYMLVNTYRNIVKICISLKETNWLEKFIKKYADKLNPEHRKEMENLSKAHLFFFRKEYEKALEKLNEIDLNFDLSKTDIKTLQLKLYYELNHVESAFHLVVAYRTFLSRTNDMSKDYKRKFKNFIQYYLILLKIKSGTLNEDPSIVKFQIEKEINIVNKQWLMEKAGEIKKY